MMLVWYTGATIVSRVILATVHVHGHMQGAKFNGSCECLKDEGSCLSFTPCKVSGSGLELRVKESYKESS